MPFVVPDERSGQGDNVLLAQLQSKRRVALPGLINRSIEGQYFTWAPIGHQCFDWLLIGQLKCLSGTRTSEDSHDQLLLTCAFKCRAVDTNRKASKTVTASSPLASRD